MSSRLEIQPTGPVDFDVTVPGSKSLTNRALICAALADGRSTLTNASLSDDSRHLARALNALGVPVETGEAELRVEGRGGRIPASTGDFSLGNAGTALRFLTSLLCLGEGRYVVDGDERMRERPIRGLVEGLTQLGCDVRYGAKEGHPPVVLKSDGIKGGRATIPGETSSQFISSILMAAPYAVEDVVLETVGDVASKPYIDMTSRVMRDFGVAAVQEDYAEFHVRAGATYGARRYAVECDAAGAGYFLAMAAATKGRAVVRGINGESSQAEARFVGVLRLMGSACINGPDFVEIRGGDLRGVDVDMNDMPDSVQTLAVVALFATGPTRIRNVKNLRVKETDRIAALATELRRLGAAVREFEDGLEILPGKFRTGEVETYNDHRMALSFAVAGVAAGVAIRNPDCVSKSYPGFFEQLGKLGVGITRVA